jgi:glutathione S-transferase
LQLVIANKTYSSWSLRAWILLRQKNIAFEEVRLSLAPERFRSAIGGYSPSGRVPALIDGELTVWDSLSIAEYLAERFPQHGIWPPDRALRARARSACAEMHSGFGALRQNMPMNVTALLPGMGWNVRVQRDIDRILGLWQDMPRGPNGPFLCGEFGAVDAFFAPVASRFRTYEVALPAFAQTYVDAVLATEAMQEWVRGAQSEDEFLEDDEPYRARP